LCEDGSQTQFLVGVTREGKLYKFAKNVLNTSELAGATFSPDGSTLFVNIQSPGMTLAITGPWQSLAMGISASAKPVATVGMFQIASKMC
jgi:secreted PhoX family phosphatase